MKKVLLRQLSSKIQRKTKLSQIQSFELAETLLRILYGMNGVKVWKNRWYLQAVYGIDWKNFSFTEEKMRRLIGRPKIDPQYREPMGLWYTIDSEADFRDDCYLFFGKESPLALRKRII